MEKDNQTFLSFTVQLSVSSYFCSMSCLWNNTHLSDFDVWQFLRQMGLIMRAFVYEVWYRPQDGAALHHFFSQCELSDIVLWCSVIHLHQLGNLPPPTVIFTVSYSRYVTPKVKRVIDSAWWSCQSMTWGWVIHQTVNYQDVVFLFRKLEWLVVISVLNIRWKKKDSYT